MPQKYIAVLFSAGLDSAVLAADALARGGRVRPIYVAVGFAWEAEERAMAARLFAAAPFAGRIDPLVSLAFDTPDEDVYIHGRNVILASKAAVYLSRAAFAKATAPGEASALLLGTLA